MFVPLVQRPEENEGNIIIFPKSYREITRNIFFSPSKYLEQPKHTCNLVLITSAGVTREAAGIPAIAPAISKDSGELYPLSSANLGFK